MSKKNASVASVVSPINAAAANAEQSAPNDGTLELTAVKGLSDQQLQALLKATLEEVKVRRQAVQNLLPKVGDTVRITKGKFADKTGVIVATAKTRCHISVEGFPVPIYTLYADTVPAV